MDGNTLLRGDLITLGAGLEAFGISAVNPDQGLNNCVSVSITKVLAYKNVHEFWNDVLGGDLPDTPLSVPQTVQLLHMTGWQFTWEIYEAHEEKTAYQRVRQDMLAHPGKGVFRVLAYTRHNGTGHCVLSGPVAEMMSNYEFTCYQHDTYGSDVSHEVKVSSSMFMFFLECPHNTPQWHAWRDRVFWRISDRRRDPVWQAKRLGTVNSALRILGMEEIKSWPDGKSKKKQTADVSEIFSIDLLKSIGSLENILTQAINVCMVGGK